MDENVHELKADDRRKEQDEARLAGMLGPEMCGHAVIVEGRLVPNMTATDCGNGEIALTLDGRMQWIFPRELAVHAATFAANAMAIGAGYPCFHADRKCEAFAAKVNFIASEQL